MPNDFKYGVFLSHGAKDKLVVRELANWLKKDKLRVWSDEGDSLSPRERAGVREEALEHSRVLVLCMSANAFGSDWAQVDDCLTTRQTLHIRREVTGKHRIQPAVKHPGVTDIELEATITFTYYRRTLL